MPRWLWWAPLGLLTLACSLLIFRMGWMAAFTTETDVINRYATLYVEHQQRAGNARTARTTDCLAFPGKSPGIWLVIRCRPSSAQYGAALEYHVNRLGGLEYFGNPIESNVKSTPEVGPEI